MQPNRRGFGELHSKLGEPCINRKPTTRVDGHWSFGELTQPYVLEPYALSGSWQAALQTVHCVQVSQTKASWFQENKNEGKVTYLSHNVVVCLVFPKFDFERMYSAESNRKWPLYSSTYVRFHIIRMPIKYHLLVLIWGEFLVLRF